MTLSERSVRGPTTAIVGGGRLALAIGRLLAASEFSVRMHARRDDVRTELKNALPGVLVTDDLETTVRDAEVVFLAVPAPALSEAAEAYGDYATGDQIVLAASRGVGPGFTLPHELIRAKTCVRKIGIFGGPLHVREIATGRAIPAVLASQFSEVIAVVRKLAENTPIKIHPSRDLVGVEVAGAISNVTALAAGMATALELGETARGVILTHGLVEARRLGVALGASDRTFTGLAGIGDLIPRNVSSTDRHWQVGARLALGDTLEVALAAANGKHVEGVVTAPEAAAKGRALGLVLPLVSAVERICRGEAAARESLESLLQQDLDLDQQDRSSRMGPDVPREPPAPNDSPPHPPTPPTTPSH
ncbi:MAG: NAD(P)-binding domain-containing protein [Deltaproteobacteria bacterium]|nr:NAD(P)-binding domain-containing protein [Deltaproteobacteria bacterium]